MDILVVDDETEMAALVARGLTKDGHNIRTASTGLEGLACALEHPFDVAVLDVMMPGMSGFELCRWLKVKDPRMVVILLTARGAVDDRVRGLDDGADDYITKPFAMAELLARIRAIHRRDALGTPDRVASGTVNLDLFHHHVKVNGAELPLSRTEFDVLRSLVMAEEAVVPRSQLLKEIWGTESYINPNVLDQYVSYLRRKLLSAHADRQIETVRGIGYRLVPKGQ